MEVNMFTPIGGMDSQNNPTNYQFKNVINSGLLNQLALSKNKNKNKKSISQFQYIINSNSTRKWL